jgi:ComF family protein
LSAEYFCVSCRTAFQNRFPLNAQGQCTLCSHGLRAFEAAYCFGAYEGVLRELIHLYKYAGIESLARPLGDLLMRALPLDLQFDAVAPVPLHWRRRWQRGYNQAELLARSLARRTGIPLRNCLRRRRATNVQAGLSNTRRRQNVSGAFRARADAVEGRRILLVDDVMTTGATANACAQALRRAGAQTITVLTLARVDRRFRTQEIENSQTRERGASAWPV